MSKKEYPTRQIIGKDLNTYTYHEMVKGDASYDLWTNLRFLLGGNKSAWVPLIRNSGEFGNYDLSAYSVIGVQVETTPISGSQQLIYTLTLFDVENPPNPDFVSDHLVARTTVIPTFTNSN